MKNQDISSRQSLEGKLGIIRDRVRSVVNRSTRGFFLYGPGGIGKTFAVSNLLNELKVKWTSCNSHITGAGFYEYMRTNQDSVIVIDDAEHLLEDKKALGYLRSATYGQNGQCVVTRTTNEAREEFLFSGGIIILSNKSMGTSDPLKALATRMNPAEFVLSETEKRTLMRMIANKGVFGLTPKICKEVLGFIELNQKLMNGKPLDIRFFENCLSDRFLYEKGKVESNWMDLIASRMCGKILLPQMPKNPNFRGAAQIPQRLSKGH